MGSDYSLALLDFQSGKARETLNLRTLEKEFCNWTDNWAVSGFGGTED